MRIHVEVRPDDIAAAGPPERGASEGDPLERALTRVLGQPTSVDGDASAPAHDVATIGQGQTVLVVDLPPETYAWSERYYGDLPVEPFGFDLEIEGWLVNLVRGAG